MSQRGQGKPFIHEFDVEWGDCDPADIVYYPNYYRWFDNAAHRIFRQAGFDLANLREEHDSLGFPLVHAQAEFRNSARVGDRLQVVSRVVAMGAKSITIEHRVMRGNLLLVEGREVRIMGARSPDGKLGATHLPTALKVFFGFEGN